MPTYTWYVGPASVRTIKAADWTGLSIANTGDTVWNSADTWSIDQATLSAGQIAYLAGQSDFLTGQVSVRPGGAVVTSPDAPVTQSQLSQLLRAAFASDGGSITQWVAGTFAAQGTLWGYQGTMYLRKVDGTDLAFTRSNWAALGADPGVVGGAELYAALLPTSFFVAATAAYVDVTGLSVTPVVPAGGKAIYIEADISVGVNVANALVNVKLVDVTAGVDVPGIRPLQLGATANKTDCRFLRWRLTPAAGARVYKLQVNSTPSGNMGIYGTDFNQVSSLICSVR